jgi:hypothetical protein
LPADVEGGCELRGGGAVRAERGRGFSGCFADRDCGAGGAAAATLVGTGTARLTVATSGSGSGTVVSSPSGIDCGGTCAADFSSSRVTLTAGAQPLSTFGGWSGGGCSGVGACVVTLDAAKTVSASFVLQPTDLGLAPLSHDFGSLGVGASSEPMIFTVTNSGGSASSTLLAAVDDPDYALVADGCSGKALPGGGASCTVGVVFTPSGGAGPKAGHLTVGHAAADLSGNALSSAQLSVSPATGAFGSVAAGSASAPATLTLTNNGQTASGALSIALGGTDAGAFSIGSSDCPPMLDALASCHVSVIFSPANVGDQSASMTVSASPGGTAASSLKGTGTGTLSVSTPGGGSGRVVSVPAGIDCGGSCSASFSATPVTLTATADPASDFTGWSGGGCTGSVKTCPAALAGATTQVTATFTLKPAVLAVAPTGASLGSVTVGATSSATFNVTNGGGAPSGKVSASVDDVTDYTVTGGTCLGKPVAGGGTCTVVVQFNPKSAGSLPAQLTVSASPGGSPTASLSGTGLTPPQLVVSSPTLPYGYPTINVGSTASQAFTIHNAGQSTSGVPTAPALSDTTAFTITANGCTAALAAGANCTVTVRFNPVTAGAVSSKTLTVSATPGGSAIATFSGTGQAQIVVQNGAGGTVRSSPAGMDCGSTCMYTWTTSPVTLSAMPDATHTFGGWGGACSGASCSVQLDAASKTVTATWTPIPPPTVSIGAWTSDSKNATASFPFMVLGASAECQLDGTAPTPCASPELYSGTALAPGSHTFTVSATNAVGSATDSRTFTTDAWADAVNGSDGNVGNMNSPFKTITRALNAPSNAVWANPGRYDAANGEVFPIRVNQKTLIGDIANKGGNWPWPTVIEGLGTFIVDANVIATNGGVVAGFTVYGACENGAAMVYVAGADVSIHDNTIDGNCERSGWPDGIRASDAENVSIVNNEISAATGLSLRSGSGKVEKNHLLGFAPPNYWGINVDIADARFDLGGGGLSSGGNEFFCAGLADVDAHAGGNVIHAENNIWDNAPPTISSNCGGGVEFCSATDTLDWAGAQLNTVPCN